MYKLHLKLKLLLKLLEFTTDDFLAPLYTTYTPHMHKLKEPKFRPPSRFLDKLIETFSCTLYFPNS